MPQNDARPPTTTRSLPTWRRTPRSPSRRRLCLPTIPTRRDRPSPSVRWWRDRPCNRTYTGGWGRHSLRQCDGRWFLHLHRQRRDRDMTRPRRELNRVGTANINGGPPTRSSSATRPSTRSMAVAAMTTSTPATVVTPSAAAPATTSSLAGTGNDTITWNANASGDTDGFDMVDGEAGGIDTFVVNGRTGTAETFRIYARAAGTQRPALRWPEPTTEIVITRTVLGRRRRSSPNSTISRRSPSTRSIPLPTTATILRRRMAGPSNGDTIQVIGNFNAPYQPELQHHHHRRQCRR